MSHYQTAVLFETETETELHFLITSYELQMQKSGLPLLELPFRSHPWVAFCSHSSVKGDAEDHLPNCASLLRASLL